MGLKIEAPALESNEPELTTEQKREVELAQGSAKLEPIDQKISENLTQTQTIKDYPEDHQGILKQVLAKACYVVGGENCKIEDIVIRKDNGLLEAKVDNWFYVAINPKAFIAEYVAEVTTEMTQAKERQEQPLQNPDEAFNIKPSFEGFQYKEVIESLPLMSPEAFNQFYNALSNEEKGQFNGERLLIDSVNQLNDQSMARLQLTTEIIDQAKELDRINQTLEEKLGNLELESCRVLLSSFEYGSVTIP